MSECVVYEIARYDGLGDDAQELDRIQLVSSNGVLNLRDASGAETHCEGTDVFAAISLMPALRVIRDEQEARITCLPELVGRLPFLLEPVIIGDNTENLSAKVNGTQWSAFRTDDEGLAMLPGWPSEDGPEMNPCWAEFQVGEGENNPLIGWTSIGIAVPGVAVEFACYDHGGWGTVSAVAIRPFDDFAAVFVDWLLRIEVLSGLWGGDSSPYSPNADLFETAAKAEGRKGSWSTAGDDDECDEDEDDAEVDYEVDNSGWMHLELHLTDPLIDEVRRCLNKPKKPPSRR